MQRVLLFAECLLVALLLCAGSAVAGPNKVVFYEPAFDGDTLVRITVTLNKKATRIKKFKTVEFPTGKGPTSAALDPNGDFVLVTDSLERQVSRIDLTSTGADATSFRSDLKIKVGKDPRDVVITPDGRFAFVGHYRSAKLYVIDLSTNKVIGKVGIGKKVVDLSMDPDGEWVAAANEQKNRITLVKVSSVVGALNGESKKSAANRVNVKLGGSPSAIALYRFQAAAAFPELAEAATGGMLMGEAVSPAEGSRTILDLGGVVAKAALGLSCFDVIRSDEGQVIALLCRQGDALVVEVFDPSFTNGFERQVVSLDANFDCEIPRLVFAPNLALVSVAFSDAELVRRMRSFVILPRELMRLPGTPEISAPGECKDIG